MWPFDKTKLHAGVKLGKGAPRIDGRTLRFARYGDALRAAPAVFDLAHRITNLGMLGNDQLGDCTCAGVAHLIQAWTDYNGKPFVPTEADTIDFYCDTCGYVEGDPSTDNGGILLDVLNYWRKHGFNGHSIDGYVAINTTDVQEVKNALYYFGGLYVGVALPISAQSQDVWDVPILGTRGKGAPGSWGGHCIANVLQYDDVGLTTITWGALKRMTWKFFLTYCDEAYAVLSPDWMDANGVSATGFNVAELQKDLALIAS